MGPPDTSPVLAAMGNLKALILNENNISYLHQLDMLAPLAQVTSLNIGSGNPVRSVGCCINTAWPLHVARLTSLSCRDLVLFRPYLIWRMPHLEVLNGAIVTAKEREESVQCFAGFDKFRQVREPRAALSVTARPVPHGSFAKPG